VKWVLRKFACDIAIRQESKMEVVSRQVVVSLWVGTMFNGCIGLQWGVWEVLLLFGTLKF